MALPATLESLEAMAFAQLVPDEDRAHDPDGRLIGFMLVDEVTGAKVWWALEEAAQPWCCPHVYACPSNGELECLCHGGFDVCCDSPACRGAEVNGSARRTAESCPSPE